MAVRLTQHGIKRSALVAVAALMSVGGPAIGATAATTDAAPPEVTATARAHALADLFGRRHVLRAARTSGDLRANVVNGPGTVTDVDTVGDSDPRVDISDIAAVTAGGRVRFATTLPTTPDPRTDPGWQQGLSFAGWSIDTTGDNVEDYEVGVFMSGARSTGLVVSPDGLTYFCNSNTAYSAATHTFSASVPLRCLGSLTQLNFQAGARYDTSPASTAPVQVSDTAPDSSALTLAVTASAPVAAAGYFVDGFGNLASFGLASRAAPKAHVADRFGFDIVRGIAATPDGGHLYVNDGFGGIHGVGLGTNAFTGQVIGAPYWPGWDIARGIAVAANGRGGYEVDGLGGVHPFSIGSARPVDAAVGGPYWPTWDIARGIAVLPNGRGGFVLDGFGGLHWFHIGRDRPAPTIVGAPYWLGQDRARGVVILPDGTGGYVVDAFGGLSPFGINGPPPAVPTVAPFAARGVAVIPTALGLPAGVIRPLVPLTGRVGDVVIDASNQFAYATNTSNDRIEVISLATHTVVTTINVGPTPIGVDFSPDGTQLYVANSGDNTVSVVDVATRAQLRTITIPAGPSHDHPYWIATGSDGGLLVTTAFGGGGSNANMVWVDPATDTVTPIASTTDRTHVAASRDRTKMLVVTNQTASGDTFSFDVATHTLSPVKNLNSPVEYAAMNSDGSVGLVGGVFVLDAGLNVLGTVNAGSGGVALNAAGTVGYSVSGSVIQVVNAVTFATSRVIYLTDTAGDGHGNDTNIALSPDQQTLAVATAHGVSIVGT